MSAIKNVVEESWIAVARSDEVREGDPVAFEFGGEEIALYRIAGRLYATHNVCTHAFAQLSGGYLEGYEIECPIHQGRFDVRTGQPTRAPCEEPIQTYPVRELDGVIQVALPASRLSSSAGESYCK